LVDFHGEVRRSAAVGMDKLHQAAMRFINLRRLRVGTQAENL
jgi:hypothetical protein